MELIYGDFMGLKLGGTPARGAMRPKKNTRRMDYGGRNNGNLKLRLYVSNIQGRGKDKIPQLTARTGDADFIVLNETNAHPGDEQSISLGCRGVALSDGGESKKKLGFGTAVMSKSFDPESDSIIVRSAVREIAAVRCEVSPSVFMSVVGMYCSPNDTAKDVDLFFSTKF